MTGRIRLRRLTPDDATLHYAAWFSDPEICRWITHATPTVAECRDYIRKALANPGVHLWGIFVGGRHVGNIKAEWPQPNEAVLGLLVGDPRMRGRGIGTAAIRQATKWCFREWGVDTVRAGVNPYNTRSMRAFEKANFKIADLDPPRVWLHLRKP